MTTPTEVLPARVAVDVGGTTLKGTLVDDHGAVLARLTTPTFADGQDALDRLVHMVCALQQTARHLGTTVRGVGVAVPGLVDAATGTVAYATNLGWTDLALGDHLTRALGLPTAIEHDARAGAIAERNAHQGEPDPYDDFVFVPIGTGVAAAIVTDGRLVQGASGGAGEFGHVPGVAGTEPCTCGQAGCVEAYASASSVLRRYRTRGGHAASTTSELVARLPDDLDAQAVWTDLVDALALGLASLVAVLDPARIVIGGGLSHAGEALLGPLREAVAARLRWRPIPNLVTSALGSHAGLVGAALIATPAPPHPGFAREAARQLSRTPAPQPASPPVGVTHETRASTRVTLAADAPTAPPPAR